MKILSICTAAYNVEKTIGPMIDSILSCPKSEAIELIIVNDGSKDRTHEIVTKYMEKYPRSIIYIQKENGGSGSARNAGMQLATGKYFKLVDGDDQIETDGLKMLVEYLEDATDDLVMTKMRTVCGTNVIQQDNWSHIQYKKSYDIDEIASDITLQMHNITVRREIISEHKIQLSEKTPYVDMEYISFVISYTKKIAFLDIGVYVYHTGLLFQSTSDINRLKNKRKMGTICSNISRYYTDCMNAQCLSIGQQQVQDSIISKLFNEVFCLYLRDKLIYKAEFMELDAELLAYGSHIQVLTSRNRTIDLLRKSHYSLYGALHVIYVGKHWIYKKLNKVFSGNK